MDLQLKGKTALVSGSTAGIGLAIAQALAREGAAVAVNGRTRERVDEAVAAVKKAAPQATVTGIPADLSTADGAATVAKAMPGVELLINNLGAFEPKPFEQLTDEDWEWLWQTNVMSGVRLSRQYLPRMLERGWGRIVFISSESALNIPTEMIHYGTTKTAQLAIARGLADMTAGTAVTVNSVLAGPTKSEGVGTFIGQLASAKGVSEAEIEKEFFKSVRPTSLLKRFEAPEEIAAVVAFVASPVASAINGAALRAEGGLVRSIV